MKKQLVLAVFCVLFTGAMIASDGKQPAATTETTKVVTQEVVVDNDVKTESLRSRVTTSVKTTLNNRKVWCVAAAALVVGSYVVYKAYKAYKNAQPEQA